MAHSKETTAVLTANEPKDGSKLVVDRHGKWLVIYRDDAEAKRWTDHADERWFDGEDPTAEPMSLHQHLKYADAVYALGEKIANFK